jgi:ATP diphosphatase
MNTNLPIQKLLDVMARLRDPETGCPWDVKQTFQSIAPCAIEEAYEVAHAIDNNDMDNLQEELGDLLLQVVFHSQMAKEQNLFTFDDVVEGLVSKLVSRHPHVFGEENAVTSDDVMKIWSAEKQKEKAKKGIKAQNSILDDVPPNLPAIVRMQKMTKIAAGAGFEWENTEGVLDKIEEEIREFRAALAEGKKTHIAEEMGDVFFTLVQLARWLDFDSEEIIRKSNLKFYNRFSGMERDINLNNEDISSLSSEKWEEYWQKQKKKKPSA